MYLSEDNYIGQLPERLDHYLNCSYGVCKIIPHAEKRITGLLFRSRDTNVGIGVCSISTVDNVTTVTKIRTIINFTVTLIPESGISYGNLYQVKLNDPADYLTDDNQQLYIIGEPYLWDCWDSSQLNTNGIAIFTSANSVIATTSGRFELSYIGDDMAVKISDAEKAGYDNSVKSGLHLEENKYLFGATELKLSDRNTVTHIERKGNVVYGVKFYVPGSVTAIKIGVARKKGDWYDFEEKGTLAVAVYGTIFMFSEPLVLKEGDEIYFYYLSYNDSLYKSGAPTSRNYTLKYKQGASILTEANACPAVSLLEGVITEPNYNSFLGLTRSGYVNFDSHGYQFYYKEIDLSVDCSNPLKSTLNTGTGMFPLSATTYLQPQNKFTAKAWIIYPEGYTPTKKYPIALQCHQNDADYTSILSNNDYDAALYLASLGYVVASTDAPKAWADSIGGFGFYQPAGNYAQMRAYKALYDYICDNLYVNPLEVYAFGFSQGGHSAMCLAEISGIPIKAVAANCPVISMKFQQWALNKANVAAIYGFAGTTAYEPDKVAGYDLFSRNSADLYEGFVQVGSTSVWNLPAGTTLNNITMKRYFRTPLKLICATNDEPLGYHFAEVFAKAIKNAGCICDIKVLNGAAHGASSIIGTFSYQGNSNALNLWSTPYEMALWFSRWSGIDPIYTPV